jgi:hypothetical protein
MTPETPAAPGNRRQIATNLGFAAAVSPDEDIPCCVPATIRAWEGIWH